MKASGAVFGGTLARHWTGTGSAAWTVMSPPTQLARTGWCGPSAALGESLLTGEEADFVYGFLTGRRQRMMIRSDPQLSRAMILPECWVHLPAVRQPPADPSRRAVVESQLVEFHASGAGPCGHAVPRGEGVVGASRCSHAEPARACRSTRSGPGLRPARSRTRVFGAAVGGVYLQAPRAGGGAQRHLVTDVAHSPRQHDADGHRGGTRFSGTSTAYSC